MEGKLYQDTDAMGNVLSRTIGEMAAVSMKSNTMFKKKKNVSKVSLKLELSFKGQESRLGARMDPETSAKYGEIG